MVYAIATDRSKPYVHTETKRVRNVIRFGEVRNPPVYKYAYMTPDFVIGSLQGGILQPIQQHTWDVTFLSPKPNNTIFTLHPFASGRELAMFFPEEQQFLAGEVDRYHKVYTSPDKWNSSSFPDEQAPPVEVRHRVLYDIPPGTSSTLTGSSRRTGRTDRRSFRVDLLPVGKDDGGAVPDRRGTGSKRR